VGRLFSLAHTLKASALTGLITAACLGNGVLLAADPGVVLSGRALLDADPPRLPTLAVSEPACRALHPNGLPDERIIAGPHRELANVFVWIKAGLAEARYPAPSAPVRIDQHGCRYDPHVFGIRAGQVLEIVNSDPVLHNIHALAKSGAPFNAAMPPRPQPWTIRRTFSAPEVMVRIRCDVHGWMSAWAGVLPHPFFAVTGPDGRFALPPLPPGTYTLAAWHEACGIRTRTVVIGAGGPAVVEFLFHAPRNL